MRNKYQEIAHFIYPAGIVTSTGGAAALRRRVALKLPAGTILLGGVTSTGVYASSDSGVTNKSQTSRTAYPRPIPLHCRALRCLGLDDALLANKLHDSLTQFAVRYDGVLLAAWLM